MGDIDVEAQETVVVPVTWNDADRDAGIDWWIANAKFWHEQCIEAWHFRDANAVEVARLRSVVAGVEALADEIERPDDWDVDAVEPMIRRHWARRLRSVLSDTKGDARVLVSTDPDDDHSRAYEAAVAAREEQRND